MKCPVCRGKLGISWNSVGNMVRGVCCSKCGKCWESDRVSNIHADLRDRMLSHLESIVGYMDFDPDDVREFAPEK